MLQSALFCSKFESAVHRGRKFPVWQNKFPVCPCRQPFPTRSKKFFMACFLLVINMSMRYKDHNRKDGRECCGLKAIGGYCIINTRLEFLEPDNGRKFVPVKS